MGALLPTRALTFRLDRPASRWVPMHSAGSYLCWALVIASLSWSQRGSGAESPDPGATRIVMLASRKSRALTKTVLDATQAQLVELSAQLLVEWVDELAPGPLAQVGLARRVAKSRDARAVVWTDASRLDRVFLYLSGRQEERIFVRRVQSESAGLQGRAEAIALVVRAAVKGILYDGEMGLEETPDAAEARGRAEAGREDLAAPAADRALAAFDLRDRQLEVTAAYGVLTYAPQYPVSQAATVGVSAAAISSVRAVLSYRYEAPRLLRTDVLSVAFAPHPFEIGAQAGGLVGPLLLSGGAGLVFDYLSWRISGLPPSYVSAAGHARWLWSGALSGSAQWPVTARLGLLVRLGIEMPFNERSYVVEGSPGKDLLVEPWALRAFTFLGVVFSPG